MDERKKRNIRFNYNLISIFVYVVGIVLLARLFNLQIINGAEYRQKSNTRLTRETTLEAARGSILDRTGNPLVANTMGFAVQMYKTKIDNQVLNNTILKTINVLEKNGDTYVDHLPILIEPFRFNTDDEDVIKKWKKENKLEEDLNAEQCFYKLREKYEIQVEDIFSIRKIMCIRYEISINGYSNTVPVEISGNISRISVLELSEQSSQFPGIDIVTKPIVNYTSGTLASHILGTVGKITKEELEQNVDDYNQNDIIGKTGIQYVFETYLKGEDGIRQVDIAVDGTITGEYISKEAVAGSDVVLTIDANLQEIAERALKTNIENIRNGKFGEKCAAEAGAIVVMNVNTGEVLAIASYPDYEPQLFVNGISNEKYAEYTNVSALYNRAISGAYAPGSTFKMITAITGLETGAITINETINDTGVYPHAHKPVCWIWTSSHRGHGYLNVSNAIKQSCNYFFYEVGNRVGIDNLEKYAKYFGLGRKTGIEVPSESSGNIASKKRAEEENRSWYLGETLSAAIGQSYNNFTPIQMAKYISMLANGGIPIDVTIVKSIINSDGTEVTKEEIEEFVKIKLQNTEEELEKIDIDKENLQAVLEGMRGVTSESGGTAYSYFRDFNIEVGGKTGSAQAGPKTNAWFVGFAPYDNPEIAVVVVVENGGHGAYTAGVAREIFAEYFGMNANKVVEDMTAEPSIQTVR